MAATKAKCEISTKPPIFFIENIKTEKVKNIGKVLPALITYEHVNLKYYSYY